MSSFDALGKKIAAALGLTERANWHSEIRRAVEDVCERYSCTVEELYQRIDGEPALMTAVASYLTISETYFLRHASHFATLVSHAEALLHTRALPAKIVVWSAGCSTGEEPYSIALALHRAFGSHGLARFEIIGNDISEQAIDKATRAAYSPWSFRNVPPWLLSGYFQCADANRCNLAPHIQSAVRFHRDSIGNVAKQFGDDAVDIVFFRNVAIYFTQAAIRETFKHFERVLRPDGLLIVAPSDPRPETGAWRRLDDESTSVYRRQDATKADGRAVLVGAEAAGAQLHSVEGGAGRSRDSGTARSQKRRRTGLEDGSLRGRSTSPAATPRGSTPSFSAASSAVSVVQQRSPGPSAAAAVVAQMPARTVHGVAFDVLGSEQLADAGETQRAISIVTAMIASDAAAADAYMLRGKLHMADNQGARALEDFRRVVFLRPDDRLARYWLANAFLAADERRRASAELKTLRSALAALAADVVLEDRETTAGELLDAVEVLWENLT